MELCSHRRWGTVCDNQWTDNHTTVVCRHLGFSDDIGSKYKVHFERYRIVGCNNYYILALKL